MTGSRAANSRYTSCIKLKLCLVGEQKDQIAIATRPDAPNLAAWIDVVLDNVGLQMKPSGIFSLGTDWTF